MKYSEFFGFPIKVYVGKPHEKEVTDSDEDEEGKKEDEREGDGDEPRIEDVEEEHEWEQLLRDATLMRTRLRKMGVVHIRGGWMGSPEWIDFSAPECDILRGHSAGQFGSPAD